MNVIESPVLTLDTILDPGRSEAYAWQNGDDQVDISGLRMDWVCIEDATRLFPALEGADRVQAVASEEPPKDPTQVYYEFAFDGSARSLYIGQKHVSIHHALHRWLRSEASEVMKPFADHMEFYGWIEEVK